MLSNTAFWITLVRHGRTEANDRAQIQGHYDTKLNETGVKQAQALAKKLASQTFDRIYTSDLARAHDTARELVPNKDAIQPDARLRERSLGSLDGQHSSVFLDQCRELDLHPDDHTPADGETLDMVRARVHDFIHNQLLHEACTVSNPVDFPKVLLVSHGVSLREMIKYFHSFGHESWSSLDKQINPSLDIPPNTSVSEFKVHLEPVAPNSPQRRIKTVEVVRLHDDSHLEEEGLRTHWPTMKQMQQLNGSAAP